MCQFSSLKTTPGKSFLPHLSLYINYLFVCGSLVCILVSTPAGEISEECTLGKAPVRHSAHGMLSCGLGPGSLRNYPDRAWKFLKARATQILWILALLPKLPLWAKGFFLSPACTFVFPFINIFSHPLPIYCSEEPCSLMTSSLIAVDCHGDFLDSPVTYSGQLF